METEAPTPRITEHARSTVTPAATSPAGHLFLPSVDLLCNLIGYVRRVIFYDNPSDDAVDVLRRSLSEVLVHYYPLAGRLVSGTEDSDSKLVIDCNDLGVEFVEAVVEDFPISELAADGFPNLPWYDQLCRKIDGNGDGGNGVPLLAVQTGISCGRNAFTRGDGWARYLEFSSGVGECASGVALSEPPIHDRRRLALKDPPSDSIADSYTADIEAKPEDYENLGDGDGNGDGYGDGETDARKTQLRLTSSVFELSGENIAKLKAEAGGNFTSFQVMCAHLWQRTAFAAGPVPLNTPTAMCIAADCRRRVVPPLPDYYFGNVITFCRGWSTVGRIRRESIRETAARVHEVVSKAVTLFEAQSHWLELGASGKQKARFVGRRIMVSGSHRFPVYKVDFGWGVPSSVRIADNNFNGGTVMLGGRPGSSSGDVEIILTLPEAEMQRLRDDPLFLASRCLSSTA